MKFYTVTLRSIAPIFLMGLIAFSCGDDDESGDPDIDTTKNEFVLGDQTFETNEGIIEDYGASGFTETGSETHYNYDFIITDGEITLVVDETGDEDLEIINGTYSLYIELFSFGTNEFKTGNFIYVDDDNYSTEEEFLNAIANKNFFETVEVSYDENGDGDLWNDSDIEATGGTITVSGSANTYTLTFDLTMTGGKSLKGSYSGTFAYREQN